jgi:hypothetical protein
VFTAVQPVMFFLLFVYVFGGAIQTANPNYVSFLLPGIIVQTALMGAMMTGISIANDLQAGVMDRFRSLPMWHMAVLSARVLTDLCRNLFTLGIMIGLGFLVGFNIGGSILGFFAGIGVALAFSFAFSWISATIGNARTVGRLDQSASSGVPAGVRQFHLRLLQTMPLAQSFASTVPSSWRRARPRPVLLPPTIHFPDCLDLGTAVALLAATWRFKKSE